MQFGENGKDRLDDFRRQAERRLVEQEQAGKPHERAAQSEHLLLAAGEQSCPLALALEKARKRVKTRSI